ncbi:MAG: aminopeptidase P family protein [Methanomicrobiales archaeon]|nr:aminopeptidase P family protein [Methanomicrobiales archaeon]
MDKLLIREYEIRHTNVRKEMARRGLNGLLVFGLAPRRVGDLMYLTGHQPLLPGHPRRYGFRGRGYSVIFMPLQEAPCLLTTTPFFEKELFIKEVIYGDDLPEEVAKAVTRRGLEKKDIGIVGMDILGVSLYEDLKRNLPQTRFVVADDVVMNLRASKSPYELAIMRNGAAIADEVADMLRGFLRVGLTENEVYRFIVGELTKRGVTGAFATCQSGERSETAYDLSPATDKVIESGDMVHMEINGKFQGYMIDICRSTVVGSISDQQRLVLDTALLMFHEAVRAMKPGVFAEDLEKISGEIALSHGFVSNHTRSFNGPATFLGHAIGLGVDEPPVVAAGDMTQLAEGMVITIEPGLYRTGCGGCRIEDEILVTSEGHENLNESENKWW